MCDAHPGSAGVLACAVFPVPPGVWFVAFFPDRFGFILEDVSGCLGRGPQQVLAQPADAFFRLLKEMVGVKMMVLLEAVRHATPQQSKRYRL